MNIEQDLKSVITERFGIAPDQIKLHTSFKRDLAFDSLDMIEIIISVEKKYLIKISDNHIALMNNLEDLIICIKQKRPDLK